MLLFQFVNRRFRDAISEGVYGMYDPTVSMLRWATATLTIVFPVYLWTTRAIRRDLARAPEKRRLRTRRWLLHFTLFAAAVTIIGDLVALVNHFLTGELTSRFVLKVIIILAIAAVVFASELGALREDAGEQPPVPLPWLRYGAIVGVTMSVIAGFWVSGSPIRERLRQADAMRVNNLQSIQSEVVRFWQRTGRLPTALGDLTDAIAGYAVPRDPATNQPYEYRVVGAREFELCATFRTDGSAQDRLMRKPAPYPIGAQPEWNWTHGEGRTCFTRTIDPTRYPIQDPTRKVPSAIN
ncbi:hypothetical protein HY480_04600, partial [Candidatus Uhrbacteria bacterium]|nr:hypothetical protein [Candidatus Uhrbacteria bacterium]